MWQFLKGTKTLNGTSVDVRLPIITRILHKIISAIPTVVILASHSSMLKAMFLLCLNAFLRMGETCSSDLVIQRHDLSFMHDADKVTGVSIVIRNYKYNLKLLPVTLFYLQTATMFNAVQSKCLN